MALMIKNRKKTSIKTKDTKSIKFKFESIKFKIESI